MITRIHGKLLRVGESTATLSCAPFDYEILVPEFARRQLESEVGQEIHLHTVHYLEGNPAQGRLTPRLVGFTSDLRIILFRGRSRRAQGAARHGPTRPRRRFRH